MQRSLERLLKELKERSTLSNDEENLANAKPMARVNACDAHGWASVDVATGRCGFSRPLMSIWKV
jgi:hypothetical protein